MFLKIKYVPSSQVRVMHPIRARDLIESSFASFQIREDLLITAIKLNPIRRMQHE